LSLQPPQDGNGTETFVQVIAFDHDPQGFDPPDQSSGDLDQVIVRMNELDRQSKTDIFVHHIGGGTTIKTGRPLPGFPPTHPAVRITQIVLAVIGFIV
jgi:hypothetical protein